MEHLAWTEMKILLYTLHRIAKGSGSGSSEPSFDVAALL